MSVVVDRGWREVPIPRADSNGATAAPDAAALPEPKAARVAIRRSSSASLGDRPGPPCRPRGACPDVWRRATRITPGEYFLSPLLLRLGAS